MQSEFFFLILNFHLSFPDFLRFHTNSNNASSSSEERTCALCLNVMDHANAKKICNSCMTKHNFTLNMQAQNQVCNLCKSSIDGEKFRDHLIEHEMENGTISCVVCTSIFTSIVGLRDHIREHSLTAMDLKEVCVKCNSRFLYPSELSHHLLEHEKVENQNQFMKQEDEVNIEMKDIKEEDEDDYIEIEKVVENSA